MAPLLVPDQPWKVQPMPYITLRCDAEIAATLDELTAEIERKTGALLTRNIVVVDIITAAAGSKTVRKMIANAATRIAQQRMDARRRAVAALAEKRRAKKPGPPTR